MWRACWTDGRRDLTPWLEYFVSGILVEATRAESRMRADQAAPVAAPRLRLTAPQRTIMAVTARLGVAANADQAAAVEIGARGIRKASAQLVDAGLLARQGETRGALYQLTPAGRAALAWYAE